KLFAQYHGADPSALEQVKQIAAKSPLPPSGFSVQSIADIAAEKQADFEKSHPQLALWTRIKASLSANDGEHYFASDLKDTSVPKLRGTLVEAKPACRPTQLLITVSAGDPEITLKLDGPLAGEPELRTEIQWEGVPSAFTQSPFMLTMDAERANVEGIK